MQARCALTDAPVHRCTSPPKPSVRQEPASNQIYLDYPTGVCFGLPRGQLFKTRILAEIMVPPLLSTVVVRRIIACTGDDQLKASAKAKRTLSGLAVNFSPCSGLVAEPSQMGSSRGGNLPGHRPGSVNRHVVFSGRPAGDPCPVSSHCLGTCA